MLKNLSGQAQLFLACPSSLPDPNAINQNVALTLEIENLEVSVSKNRKIIYVYKKFIWISQGMFFLPNLIMIYFSSIFNSRFLYITKGYLITFACPNTHAVLTSLAFFFFYELPLFPCSHFPCMFMGKYLSNCKCHSFLICKMLTVKIPSSELLEGLTKRKHGKL